MVQEVVEEIIITVTLLFIVVLLVTISTTYTATTVSHGAIAHGVESSFNILKALLSGITDACLCRDQVSEAQVKLFYPERLAVKMKTSRLDIGVEEFDIEIVLRIPVNIVRGGLHDYDNIGKAYCKALLEKWANVSSRLGLRPSYDCSFNSWSDSATAYYQLSVRVVVNGCRGDEYNVPEIDVDLRSPRIFSVKTDYNIRNGLFVCSLEGEPSP